MLSRALGLAPAELEAALEEVEAYLLGQGVDESQRFRVRLVLDELVANLAMHGRFPAEAEAPLRLEVEAAGGAIELAIEDSAEPFDPRTAPGPDSPPSLDDDRIGGLGLALVRKMAEIRAYRRLPEGRNRTELVLPARARPCE